MKDFIYNLIPTDRYISRRELIEISNMNDRELRRCISDIRKEHNIISLSSGKGYRRPKHTSEMTKDEIKEEYDVVKHQIAENNSRIKNIKKNMRMQIAYLKMLEKNME